MSRYKVLRLERWMTLIHNKRFAKATPKLTEVSPFFNRDGYYFDRIDKKCWLEFEGKAYLHDKESFLFELDVMNFSKPRNSTI